MRNLFSLVAVAFALLTLAQTKVSYQPQYAYYIASINAQQLDFAIKNNGKELPAEWINNLVAKGDTLYVLKEKLPLGSYIVYSRGGKKNLSTAVYTKNSYTLTFYKTKSAFYLTIVDENLKPVSNASLTSLDKKIRIKNNAGIYVISSASKKKNRNPKIIINHNNELGYYQLIPANSSPVEIAKTKTPKHQALALLSQSVYRPLDTLRFSCVFLKGGNVHKKPMNVYFREAYDYYSPFGKFAATLHCDENGIYTMNYVLPDSWDLDKRYELYYEINPKKSFGSLGFSLKDYELDKTDVDVQTIHKNDTLQLAISVKDNNGFSRIGSTIHVAAVPEVSRIFGSYLFIPTVFWEQYDTLKKDEILRIVVPDSLIKLFTGSIRFEIAIKTPTGELFSESIYEYLNNKGEFKVSSDSFLHIEYLEKEKSISTQAVLEYAIADVKHRDTIHLPYHQAFNEYINYSQVTKANDNFSLSFLNAIEGAYIVRNKELLFYLKNTHKQEIWVEMYKGTAFMFAQTYNDTTRINFDPNAAYSMRYNYVKNGAMHSQYIGYTPQPNTLDLAVSQPISAQPGKAVTFDFTATDIDGKPVKNAFVLGTSVSSQMPGEVEYTIPQNDIIPIQDSRYSYYSTKTSNDVIHTSVSGFVPLRDIPESIINLADYKAIYFPTNSVNTTYLAIDSAKHSKINTINYGQFWPRITDKKFKEIAVYQVFVDGVLKYDKALGCPETMLVSTGKHQVEIRTYNRLYLFKDVEIRLNEKLILSFNEELNTQKLSYRKKRKVVKKKHLDQLTSKVTLVQNLSNQDIIVQSVGHFATLLSKTQYYYATPANAQIAPLWEGSEIEIVYKNGNKSKFRYTAKMQYIITDDEVLRLPISIKTEREKLPKYATSLDELITLYPYQSLRFAPKKLEKTITWNSVNSEYGIGNFTLIDPSNSYRSRLFVFQSRLIDSAFMLQITSTTSIPVGEYTLYEVSSDSFVTYSKIRVQPNGRNYYMLDSEMREPLDKKADVFDKFDTQKSFLNSIKGKKGVALELFLNEDALAETFVTIRVENGPDKLYTTNRLGQLFIPMDKDESLIIKPKVVCGEDSLAPMLVTYKSVLGVYTLSKKWDCKNQYAKSSLISAHNLQLSYENCKPNSSKKIVYRKLACPDFGESDASESLAEVSALRTRNLTSVSFKFGDSDGSYDTEEPAFSELTYDLVDDKNYKLEEAKGNRKDATDYFIDGIKVISDSLQKPTMEVRDHFSDLGFWMPALRTNEFGKASFTTTLPDDITTWRNFFITADNHHRSATKTTFLKSYKPVMAQLHTPRFLIQGDQAWIKGELLNTTPDSLLLDYKFSINNTLGTSNSVKIGLNYFAKQKITVTNNYVSNEYTVQFETTDNKLFADAEKRKIPIYKQGLLAKSGKVWVINAAESIDISVNPEDSSYLTLLGSPKEVLREMLQNVVGYAYNCNEQMASKLRALLILRNYDNSNKQQNEYEKQVKEYVKELTKNQQENGSWGWWPNTRSNIWMTCYITEALYKAQEAGYGSDAVQKAQTFILSHYANSTDEGTNILIVNTLLNTNAPLAYDQVLMDLSKYTTTEAAICSARLSYLLKQDSPFASLEKIKNTDILGHTYWGVDSMNFGSTHLQNTCNVYSLIKDQLPVLAETTQQYLWYRVYAMDRNNTYEAIWLAEALYANIQEIANNKPCIITQGNDKQELSYNTKQLLTAKNLKITNPNSERIYAIVAKEKWETNPPKRDSLISVTTSYANTLKANEPLVVKAKVSSASALGYVKISVPIPAGCSYNGDQVISNATHTEFYKNYVNIYIENMASGEHEFDFQLLPKYEGDFSINPASAELMYFPVINGNNELKKVIIE